MADDRYHEFHLEGKQLAFLFMTATAVVVVSFLVGVMVGRGVQSARAESMAADAASADGGAATAPPAREMVAEADVTADTPRDDFSYYERLNSPTAVAEPPRTRAPERPEAVREPAPGPPPPAASVAAASTARTATAPPPPAASVPPAQTVAAAAPAITPPARPPAALAPASGSGFSVQVMSVATREQAESARRSLASKGYPAFVQAADGRFRVRVGPYQDRKEADSVARRLETVEKFNGLWVAAR